MALDRIFKHFVFFILILIPVRGFSQSEPVLKIGLVADPQYQDKDPSGKRYYRESLWKLEEAIDTFNFYNVDFIQNLGDIIDREWKSFDGILPVYKKAKPGIEVYHLLGNHDFAVDSSEMPGLTGILGMPDYYYSYLRKGWRFIVLNAMDYSILGNDLFKRDSALVNAYYNSTLGKPNHYRWNGAIGPEQQEWLKNELKEAESGNQQAIVFCHMPLLPDDVEERLWNADEIMEILESSPAVKAYINGHRHKGAYAFHNGIHYISIFGMVDTQVSSYAILEIYEEKLELKGFGEQITPSVPLLFKTPLNPP
jgi:hypothetical protein